MSFIETIGLSFLSPFTEYFSIRDGSELTIYGLFERVNVSCAILGHAGSVATPVYDLSVLTRRKLALDKSSIMSSLLSLSRAPSFAKIDIIPIRSQWSQFLKEMPRSAWHHSTSVCIAICWESS